MHIFCWPRKPKKTTLNLIWADFYTFTEFDQTFCQTHVKLDPCIWIFHMHCYISLAIAPCYSCIMFGEQTTPVATQNEFQMTQTDIFIPCSHFMSYMISYVCHPSSYTDAPSYMGATMEEILTLLPYLFYLHALTGYDTVELSITLVRVKYTKSQVLSTGSSPWNSWFLYIRCSGRGCNILCFS